MLALPYYEEKWRDIKGYENIYLISSFRKVLNLETGNYLKPFDDGRGYLAVNLYKDGKMKTLRLHRLIAETFIPNPYNKPCIDHINTYKDDNRIENLKWVTHKENNNNPLTKEHLSSSQKGEKAYWYKKTGKEHPRSKPVLQFDLDGNFIKIWENARIVENELNIDFSNLASCCRGKRKSAGGYIWKYKN